MMLMGSLGFYYIVIIERNIGKVDLPQATVDAIALTVSVLAGAYVAELRNPLKTLGETLSEGGWKKVYLDVLAAPALTVGPVYGAMKLGDSIVEAVIADNSMAIVLIPATIMVIIAFVEFVRREVTRK